MSEKYEPSWIEIHWKHIQLTIIVSGLSIIVLIFWFILEEPFALASFSILIVYIVLFSTPPRGIAKERLDQDRLRLSLYIEIIGDILAASESPVETFNDLIKYFVSINRFSEDDLSLIISHFADRADSVGVEVRRLLKENERE
ncbi:MAG: hypothetical protein ACFFEK_04405 [Candidatus Thorarchaeota archaeon]